MINPVEFETISPIEFIDNNIIQSIERNPEGYSVIICSEIVDFISNMYNFEIEDISFNDRGRNSAGVFHDKEDKSKVIYKLKLTIYDFSMQLFRKRIYGIKNVDIFLEHFAYDYEITIARYVFTVLHELGHVNDYKIHERDIKKYLETKTLINNMITLIDNPDLNSYDERNRSYITRPGEASADRFAYQHFPMVWNMLKYKRII